MHVALCNLRERLKVWSHVTCTQSTVETNADGLGVGHRGVESLNRLARESTSGLVGDSTGDDQGRARNLSLKIILEVLVKSVAGRLGVQSVEHRLNHEDVHATLMQPLDLFLVGFDHFLPRHSAEGGVLHIGRHRKRLVGGANGARNKPRLGGVVLGHLHGRSTAHLHRGFVEVVYDALHFIVGLGDRCAVERVCLADIGARTKILLVDLGDDVGAGEHEDVVVALQRRSVALEPFSTEILLLKLVALNHRAHGSIENRNTALE
mmetsp:Transcript_27172/g.52686  ORF Transcript_27172/g.52686 Transcript_27172/m.52686 type:complete len:264 (+) Transcript_27172:3289-4080(+)